MPYSKDIISSEVMFCLTVEDAQLIAKSRFNAKLTEDELYRVQKGLECGLEDWSDVMKIAIEDVLQEREESNV